MANEVRGGIVGATVTRGGSGWRAGAHIPAPRVLPKYELVAVCTANEDTSEASAAALGAPRAFLDIDQLVAHPDIRILTLSWCRSIYRLTLFRRQCQHGITC